MQKKQVLVLWIIAGILLISLVIVNAAKDESFTSATDLDRGDTLLDDFPAEAAAQLTVTSGESAAHLQQTEGDWVVTDRNDYPADVSAINELLRTLSEVEVTQGIEADASFAPRFGMDPEGEDEGQRATELSISNDSGESLAELSFGKNLESSDNPMSPFGGGSTGRFVRNHADTSGFYVTREVFANLSADPADWLADEFFSVEKVQSITVSEPGDPGMIAWNLSRDSEQGDLQLGNLPDGETLASSKANRVRTALSAPTFRDVVITERASELWNAEQARRAVMRTFEGFTYTIDFAPAPELGDSDEENSSEPYLLRVEIEGEVPQERNKPEDESDEDAQQKDEAFAERQTSLQQKLDLAARFEGRTFEVSQSTVAPLLQSRSELMEAEQQPQRGQGMPGLRGRGGATTPPLQIPPQGR